MKKLSDIGASMLGFVMVTSITVFLTLKISGSISWSWWWVFSPLLLPVAVVFILSVVVGGLMAILGAMKGRQVDREIDELKRLYKDKFIEITPCDNKSQEEL